jgi:hypothetical protein
VGPDGTLSRQRRRVSTTETHDLQLDVTGCASAFDVRMRLADLLQPCRGLARVRLHGELAPEIDLRVRDLADGAPWLDGLAVEAADLQPTYDLERLALEPTVRGEFVREVRAAALPKDQRRRVLVTGLRALDGRDDLDAAYVF